MDTAIETVLRDYEARSVEDSKRMKAMDPKERAARVDEFLLAVGRGSGTLLNLLVKERDARTILEVGTSYGYSTVWLAEAARATGGKVVTMEIHPDKQKYAREQVARAGLSEYVDFRLGDAVENITKLDKPLDFVFLDCWMEIYIPCFERFYPMLSPGALVLADNMLYPDFDREQTIKYREHVRAKQHMQSVLLAVGKSSILDAQSGVELSRCTRGLEGWLT